MSANVLIKGGRVIDPSQSVDEISDLLVTDGIITEINTSIDRPRNSEVFDAEGKIVCPGFIDLHCHLREPGEEHKETIATGTLAAAQGGFSKFLAF